ncbi:OsmC family protein [Parasedimentitalea psychrophila]|uniref:OsmC family protein n=1 Tax=Parasedimentitalea psychrophila TaxID=2997337 RepID=A0A9Y2KYR8_9RHOB|nr:OsmC family protein [Parasedimentitalea psychrophila]WIY24501.1 OsmC family protein [Parasedimentitalea psychrophila]
MALKIRPKSFGPVFVSLDDKDAILFAFSDPSDTSPYPPTNTPVDTLLASLGSCIVKSIQWSAEQRKVDLNPFTVKVEGTKSTELPGRLERVDITIFGTLVADEALAPRIVKQAKAICTVSNSLNSDLGIKIQAGPIT